MVLYIAFMPFKSVSVISKYGDLSYGIYIYGFLVQQIIMNYNHKLYLHPYLLFICALPITLLCAFLSWHLIESRALKLKKIDQQERFINVYGKISFHIKEYLEKGITEIGLV
jgi:peptidoglycan/LPS O-acetylase OafA/YrhL